LNQLEDLIENPESIDKDDRDRIGHLEQLHEEAVLSQLEQLHEDAVRLFVHQSGFGVSRMPSLYAWRLTRGLRTEEPLPQPGTRTTPTWSTADFLKPQPPGKDDAKVSKELLSMHTLSVVDFVNPNGFGFFKDRRHVAGFQAHQFSKVPVPMLFWKMQTIDLVGLVVHEEPLVYVSSHLPRMDELRDAPTRPLDAFESHGLKALRSGEELFVRSVDWKIRVLGAVRSAKQCLACHGGQRGDLLGAFSYTLAYSTR
jgi:hypothetical protein